MVCVKFIQKIMVHTLFWIDLQIFYPTKLKITHYTIVIYYVMKIPNHRFSCGVSVAISHVRIGAV